MSNYNYSIDYSANQIVNTISSATTTNAKYDQTDGKDHPDYGIPLHIPQTVYAEPVRYGRWIEVDVGDCCYRCSECGFIRDAYLLDIGNYCPQCGAKMDIDKSPTVKAIPIEWIKKRIENWADYGTQYLTIIEMLEDWREENEMR